MQIVDNYVKEWNEKYPYDYYYRTEYNIPIFSEIHNNTSFFAMICWWREKIMKNPKSKEQQQKDELEQLLLKRKEKLSKS